MPAKTYRPKKKVGEGKAGTFVSARDKLGSIVPKGGTAIAWIVAVLIVAFLIGTIFVVKAVMYDSPKAITDHVSDSPQTHLIPNLQTQPQALPAIAGRAVFLSS